MSTVVGLTVFLTLLTFGAHVLVNLWLVSSIHAIAHDAATDVASSGVDDAHLADVEAAALERADAALGSAAEDVTLAFESSPPDRIVLRVRAPDLAVVPGPIARLTGARGLDRRITVQREAETP